MSEYLALYRKYRPLTFEDVIGQEHITTVLKNEIKNNTVSHAYLFCGSRGTGKTTCAKILANAVNCENTQDGNPCMECSLCKSARTSFDIYEIDAASHNGVDDIRELRDNILYPPSELKKRVYIVDEVHMLSTAAFNALLKTLEEPPAHAMFILATTEINKIPATILSRCKRFDFHRITPEDIAKRLRFVSDNENIDITDDALMLIARLATGAMRDALSMLELFVGKEGKTNAEDAAKRLGVVGHTAVMAIIRAICENDSKAALDTIHESYVASKDMESLCSELFATIRNILMIKYTAAPEKFIEEHASVLEELKALADKFSAEKLIYCTKILEETQSKLARSTFSRRYVLELAALRLCKPEMSDSTEALLSRIEDLEEKVSILSVSGIKPSAKPKEEKKPKEEDKKTVQDTAKQPPTQEPSKDQRTPMAAFGELLEAVKKKDAFVYSMLQSANAYLSENELIIKAQNEASYGILILQRNCDVISECLPKILGYAPELKIERPAKKENKSDDLSDLFI